MWVQNEKEKTKHKIIYSNRIENKTWKHFSYKTSKPKQTEGKKIFVENKKVNSPINFLFNFDFVPFGWMRKMTNPSNCDILRNNLRKKKNKRKKKKMKTKKFLSNYISFLCIKKTHLNRSDNTMKTLNVIWCTLSLTRSFGKRNEWHNYVEILISFSIELDCASFQNQTKSFMTIFDTETLFLHLTLSSFFLTSYLHWINKIIAGNDENQNSQIFSLNFI